MQANLHNKCKKGFHSSMSNNLPALLFLLEDTVPRNIKQSYYSISFVHLVLIRGFSQFNPSILLINLRKRTAGDPPFCLDIFATKSPSRYKGDIEAP